MLQYVIFDLDDTLLDFHANEQASLTTIFQRYQVPNIERARQVYRDHNRHVWQQIEHGAQRTPLLDHRFEVVFKRLGLAVNGPKAQREYNDLIANGFQIFPGAKALLERLVDRGLTLLVGTNGVQDAQLNRIKGAGIAPLFDHVFISEAVGFAKPDPHFFSAITERYPLTKTNAVMVGDSLVSDIAGAQAAGLPSVWFNPHQAPLTGPAQPTATVTSLAALQTQLLTWA